MGGESRLRRLRIEADSAMLPLAAVTSTNSDGFGIGLASHRGRAPLYHHVMSLR